MSNETLNNELTDLQNQLADVLQSVPLDVVAKNNLEAQIADKQAQIVVQEREQHIEEKIVGDEITFNVPGVDFKELPAELITLIDKVVRADRRRIYAEETIKVDELTTKHKAELVATNVEIQGHKNQVESLQEIIRNGKSANESLIHENGNLRDHMAKVNDDNADLETRLLNATAQIEESQRENERLNNEIQDMRAAANFGEKKAQQIIDITPEESSDMQNLVNNIAKKYVSVTPIAANWHELVAEDGSKTVLHTKDLPSLETQGSPFRGTDAAQSQEDAIFPPSVEVTQFPVTPPNVVTGTDAVENRESAVAGTNVGEETPVSRAEHEALQARVEALERKVA